MKNIVLILVIVFTCKISAQEQTLLSGEIIHGGFGGPEVKFTQLDQNFAVLVGGKGGWIINHQFVIGGAGYGLVNNIESKLALDDRPLLVMGYGGLYLEYIHNWDQLLHYSFSALIGAGGLTYRDRRDFDHSSNDYASKNFFVLEPGANAEVNIATFFRLNLGISYRWIAPVNFDGFTDENLSGISANLTFKFGKF